MITQKVIIIHHLCRISKVQAWYILFGFVFLWERHGHKLKIYNTWTVVYSWNWGGARAFNSIKLCLTLALKIISSCSPHNWNLAEKNEPRKFFMFVKFIPNDEKAVNRAGTLFPWRHFAAFGVGIASGLFVMVFIYLLATGTVLLASFGTALWKSLVVKP